MRRQTPVHIHIPQSAHALSCGEWSRGRRRTADGGRPLEVRKSKSQWESANGRPPSAVRRHLPATLPAVLSTFLVLALLVIPIGAGIASGALAGRLGQNARWLDIGARVALIAVGWLVLIAAVRGPILGWSISSWTGSPVGIDSASNRGGAAALIVFACTLLITRDETTDPQTRLTRLAAAGLSMFGALLVCLATTASGVLIGGGVLLLATVLRALQDSPGEAVLRTFATQGVGLLMGAFMLHLNVSQNASGYFSSMLTVSALSPTLISLAVLLLCGVPPFGLTSQTPSRAQLSGGALLAFGLLARTPRIETWAIALALIGALIWSARALAAARTDAQPGYLRCATLCLCLVATLSGQTWMAAIAWLAVSVALDAPLPLRTAAVAIQLALPATAGFAAWSGAIAGLTSRGALDAAIVVLAIGVTIVCAFTMLFCLLPGGGFMRALRQDTTRIAAFTPEAVVLGHALLFGIVPSLAGAPGLVASLSAMGTIGWAHLAAGLIVGGGLWQLGWRWLDFAAFDEVGTALDRAALALDPIRGALSRLQRAMRTVFALLESDGALLWAFLATIVALLSSQASLP
jgi:hypothetical protein